MVRFTVKKSELQAFVASFIDSIEPDKNVATVCGLSGNLGAGKTTFTQELARQLGVLEPITSPTFVIQKRYDLQGGRIPFDTLIHIDAYRLEGGDELRSLGFTDDLQNSRNLIIVEWPERVKSILPSTTQILTFSVVDTETRDIEIHNGKTEKSTDK